MLRRFLFGAFAVVAFAAVGLVPAAATGHAAAKTICVGLVIDPRSVGGTVSDSCATVKPGTSGVGVLEAAGHSVTFRSDGLLCTIDRLPSSGCAHVDNTHYWAYFHRGAGRTTWSYSNEGASTYEPSNRSVEGWVYDDGSSLKPENIPSATICDALVAPTASPTPTTHPTKSAAATAPAQTATNSASTGSVHHSRSPRATSSAVAKPSATASASAATPATRSPSADTSPTTTTAAHAGSSGHGSATGALIAAGVIVVLAAAAAITARRRT